MSQRYATTPHDTDRMPGGIPYIIGNELAERFSFYGMKAILTVFMTKHLLDAAGEPDYMGDEQAKGVYHLFTAAAYFFPLIGAIISDVLWGKYKTILFISLMYCLGHGMLALMDLGPVTGGWDMRPFMYIGLLLIAIGAGGIKPCVSAHVGDQFGDRNKHLISKTFSWFYFSINVGAATSSILTPIFLDKVGPWLAFGVPGVLMVIATFVFWLGRHKFVHIPPAGWTRFKEETFSPDGRRALINLAPLFLIFIPMFWAIFDQTGSAWVLQAKSMDRDFLWVTWLESQVQFVNPILILILIPTFAFGVYPFLGRFFRVTPLRKIGIGLFLTAVAFTASALIETRISGGAVDDATSSADDGGWSASAILDGPADGGGWSSRAGALDPRTDGEAEPVELTIRLRERSAWTIDAVEINPYAEAGPLPPVPAAKPGEDGAEAYAAYRAEKARRAALGQEDRAALESAPDRDNWASRVEVFVHRPGEVVEPQAGDDADAAPKLAWSSVGVLELAAENRLQALTFPPVEASLVKLRILDNHGGDRAKLGRVRVLASEGTSALAQGDGVWPDVAALGFQPNIGWQFLAYLLLTAAEVMVSITSLEFAYTQAPKKMKSFIMGVYFLGVSLGNLFTSAVNFVLDGLKDLEGNTPLSGANYYWFFTGLMLITAVAYVIFSQFYKGETYIQGDGDRDPNGDITRARAEAEAPHSP